jgi:hypothetical protein
MRPRWNTSKRISRYRLLWALLGPVSIAELFEFVFSPIPQLIFQLLALRVLATGSLDTDWSIVDATLDPLCRRGGPQLSLGAFLDGLIEGPPEESRDYVHGAAIHLLKDASPDGAWMKRHNDNGWIPPRERFCVEDVGQFGLGIPVPCIAMIEILEIDSWGTGKQMTVGAQVDNADGPGNLGLGGCRHQCWKQELGEQRMADVIRAKLNLEPILSLRNGYRRYAAVVDENIESVILRLDAFDGCCHRRQGRKVELQQLYFRIRNLRLDVLNRLCPSLNRPRAEKDAFGIVLS